MGLGPSAAHALTAPLGWDTSCPDWTARIMSGTSLVPGMPLFEAEADRALRIFKRLRVPDMVGTPTYGEACGPWAFDLVRALFGSYDTARHRRMIREFFVLIPKKNGKSSIAAAIMVTAAIMNMRPAAELLLIAPTKKIAAIAFKQAAGIIKLDTELTKLFHPQLHKQEITHRMTDAVIVIKAADADVITGSKATFILIDETHVFAMKANAADVFVEIRGSLAARPDGFLLQITTQSKEPPAGVFKSELNIARDVRDGLIRLPLLPLLYELPLDVARDGGWKNPATWPLVNPNLNRSVDEAFLRDELLKAERDGAEQLALLASQHFNVEVGTALRNDRWAGADYWDAAGDETLTLDELLERSEVVTIGIDGGGLDDLLGLGVIGRCKRTRDWLTWGHAWADRKVLELRKEIAPALLDFARDGDLTICSVPEDVSQLGALVARIYASGLLPAKNAIGFDPANVGVIVEAIVSHGVPDVLLHRVLQGPRLAPAVNVLPRKLSDGTLWHAAQPMMAWVIGNAKVEMKGNAPMVTKQVSGRAKIDPLVALLNAAILMSWNPLGIGPSVYEERGILEIEMI